MSDAFFFISGVKWKLLVFKTLTLEYVNKTEEA